ncbi:MAG TPA: tryptophan synthase subunit alpha [Planctomycetota bacterium]
MNNRLVTRMAALRARGGRGVAPYVTAGDGGLETTLAVLHALDAAGACCVELGVPFSDPIADGPVLQAAAQRALEAGTGLDGILSMLQEFRCGGRGLPGSELPVALMSYVNPLLKRGWTEIAKRAGAAGVDAFIVPDLPVEEGGPLRAAAEDAGICPIFFAAPTTSAARVRAAAEASRGFLYVVGRVGVTGSGTSFDAGTQDFLRRTRALADPLPLAVGFGIRTPADVAAAVEHADLAIVGSALVDRAHRATAGAADFVQAAAAAAGEYVLSLVAGLPAEESAA